MCSVIEVGQRLVLLLGVLYEIKVNALRGEEVGPSVCAFVCDLESATSLFVGFPWDSELCAKYCPVSMGFARVGSETGIRGAFKF